VSADAPHGSARRRGIPALVAFALAARARGRRERMRLVALFLLPIAVLAVIGVALGGYADSAYVVGVLDRAGSRDSAELVRRLEAHPNLRTRAYSDAGALASAVFRGRLVGGLEIPPGYVAGGTLPVALSVSEATPGAPVLRALVEGELADAAAAGVPARISVAIRAIGAPRIAAFPSGFQYTAPANTVLFVLVNALTGALLLLELRSRGIARRLLATPARSGELIAALALAPAQSMLVQTLFLIVTTALCFGVAWGHPLGVALVSGAWIAFGMSVSLCAGTLFRNPEQCLSLSPLVAIVLGMLGGCMWPLAVVPPLLQRAALAAPTSWALGAYLELSFLEAGPRDVLPAVGALLATSAALAAVGVVRLRRHLAG
jgi:ABC-2 type transport system permease protein